VRGDWKFEIGNWKLVKKEGLIRSSKKELTFFERSNLHSGFFRRPPLSERQARVGIGAGSRREPPYCKSVKNVKYF
jgi:hypothetical protein